MKKRNDRMIARDFKIDAGGRGEIKVLSHSFSSMNEAVRYIKAMPPSRHNRDTQYYQRGYVDHDEAWNGFKDLDDLLDICQNGLHDTGNVTEVMKYAGKAMVLEKDKLVRKTKDVCGGSVDVPLYLSGSPECMNGLKRAKVKSRVIKVAVNCEVLANISVSRYIQAGIAISKTVASLEKAGYRVRLVATAGFWDCNRETAIMSAVIKRENDAVNWRRMLMPMMSTAFWRGLAFNWVSCLQDFNPGFGLGQRIDMAFSESIKKDRMDRLVSTALMDKDFVRFSINEVIQMNDRNPPEVTEGFLRAKMLDLEA